MTPVLFDAQNWSGSEYMSFWDLLITRKCHVVCLNEFWQFSDSCVFHYIAGLKTGKKLLDHVGNYMLLDAARKIVLSAVRRLGDYGFDVPNLHEALKELKTFTALG